MVLPAAQDTIPKNLFLQCKNVNFIMKSARVGKNV